MVRTQFQDLEVTKDDDDILVFDFYENGSDYDNITNGTVTLEVFNTDGSSLFTVTGSVSNNRATFTISASDVGTVGRYDFAIRHNYSSLRNTLVKGNFYVVKDTGAI